MDRVGRKRAVQNKQSRTGLAMLADTMRLQGGTDA